MIRLGITSTDTSVAKTVVATGLTAWLRARGIDTAAMKLTESAGDDHDAYGVLSRLDAAFARHAAGRSGIIVEGAFGLLVPITNAMSYAQLFARWKLEIIIGAADTLGVINHVLLTMMAALENRLEIKAIVLYSVPEVDDTRDLSRQGNHQRLLQLVPTVPVIRFSHVVDSGDLSLLIRETEKSGLGKVAVGGGHYTDISAF